MKGITDFSQAFHMQMLFLIEKWSVKTVIFSDRPNLRSSTCSGSTKVLFISDLRQDGFFQAVGDDCGHEQSYNKPNYPCILISFYLQSIGR